MRPRLLAAVVPAWLLASCGPPDGSGASSSDGGTTGTTGAASTGAAASTTTGEPTTAAPTSSAGSAGTTAASTTTTGAATTDATTGEPAGTTDVGTTGTSGSTGDGSTGGTTGDSLDDLLTPQHMQVKGTHNSYHVEPLLPFDASHEYTHKPLDVQLESQGVRAFELDVHRGANDFEVYHIAVIDSVSTCPTLKACLGTIRTWSLAHPAHLPIVVWIEVKDSTGGLPIGAADLDAIDDTIRGVLADDHLFTPDDLQGAHPSPRAALEADGWPTLAAVRGKIMVVLLNVEDAHADDYTKGYTTLAGRAMFARATPAQFAAPWAAIAKLGIGEADALAAAHAARMLIATNVCSAGGADAACAADLDDAKAAGIHMLKDDFPAKIAGKTYFLDLPDGNPARCNPVTAPAECTSAALESL